MRIDREEALRYARGRPGEGDRALRTRLDALEGEVLAAARPRAFWTLERIVRRADGSYAVGPVEMAGRDLLGHLVGCERAFLFVATLGAGVDALLRRLAVGSTADALLAQGLATSLIESVCDDYGREMAEAVGGAGLRRRFSPGYGDLPLAVQRPLLAALDAPRRVGVSLTDALLMVPTKSVSAILGVEAKGTTALGKEREK